MREVKRHSHVLRTCSSQQIKRIKTSLMSESNSLSHLGALLTLYMYLFVIKNFLVIQKELIF